MTKYEYSLYDRQTGELVHRGTAQELVEKELYRWVESVHSTYSAQQKDPKSGRWRMERREMLSKAAAETAARKARRLDAAAPYIKVVEMRVPVYSCYDAQGQLMGKGTAKELYEAEVLSYMDAAYLYRRGKGCPSTGVVRMERTYERRKVEQRCLTAPMTSQPVQQGKEDPLQADVRALCKYNAAAKKAGKPELSYGYWAIKGKPETVEAAG